MFPSNYSRLHTNEMLDENLVMSSAEEKYNCREMRRVTQGDTPA